MTLNGIVDDENSQAEGTIEGAVGYVRNDQQLQQQQQPSQNSTIQQQQQAQPQIHPHYENIYESIEQYNAAAHGGAIAGAVAAAVAVAPIIATNNANAPAEESQQLQQPALAQPQAQQQPTNENNTQQQQQSKQSRLANNINYRNDLYDRSNAININTTAASNNNNNYDIPRSVRSGLGFRRNFQLDLHAANPRFNSFRCNGVTCNHYNANTNTSSSTSTSCYRQRSFDDTESQNYYNLNHYQPSVRYENIYEQIRDEPIYRNTNGGARVYGRLNVIGHGIGRIERHLSSSCGNIDHYNLGGHYAVLGHSHFGTVGHIRLNTSSSISSTSTTNSSSVTSTISCNSSSCGGTSSGLSVSSTTSVQKDGSNNVKNSSSFFSCLHGENTQSMSNIYKASGSSTSSSSVHNHFNMGSSNITTSSTINPSSRDRESRAASAGPLINPNANGNNDTNTTASVRTTGAIPKTKALNLGSKQNCNTLQHNANASTITEKATAVSTLKNALTKKSSSSLNSGTSAAVAATQKLQIPSASSPNSSSNMNEQNNTTLNRISKSSLQWLLVNKWLPLWMGQGTDCKVIDFNFMFSRDCVDCDAASAAAQMTNPYGTPRLTGLPQDIVRFNARAEMRASSPAYRRPNDLTNSRPFHNTLNRLRESETSPYARRYEDPSYENVHVHWQNGFEFGRSRDNDHTLITSAAESAVYQSPNSTRAPLQRARSESPNLNQRNNTYLSSSSRRLRAVNSLVSSQITSNNSTTNFSNCSSSNGVKFKETSCRNTEKIKDSNFETNETSTGLQLPKATNSSTAESSPLEDLEGAVGGIEYEVANEVTAISSVSNSITRNNETNNLDIPSGTTPALDVLDNDAMPSLDIKPLTNNGEQKEN